MKKYLLLLSCSILAANAAQALTAAEQLNATKEIFIKDFQRMDDDKDGKLSMEEYLSHQFEDFRANIINASGFSDKPVIKVEETKEEVSLSGASKTLEDMANYDMEIEEVDLSGLDEPIKLTKEDVMPKDANSKDIEVPELDLSISEEENLNNLLNNVEKKSEVKEEAGEESQEEKDKQISMMMDTIKKTLPKKIDSETTWTDIEYGDNTISYIYQANLDTTNYSENDKLLLKKNIKQKICPKTYIEMCPKIKPMFIDEGINMRIKYLDKQNNTISACEFNQQTCQ